MTFRSSHLLLLLLCIFPSLFVHSREISLRSGIPRLDIESPRLRLIKHLKSEMLGGTLSSLLDKHSWDERPLQHIGKEVKGSYLSFLLQEFEQSGVQPKDRCTRVLDSLQDCVSN